MLFRSTGRDVLTATPSVAPGALQLGALASRSGFRPAGRPDGVALAVGRD